jgi:alpha-glucosidase (family GH31 glycosyl hydrolase)
VEAWNGQEFHGGQHLKANAPLERIPVYWRKGSKYQFKF